MCRGRVSDLWRLLYPKVATARVLLYAICRGGEKASAAVATAAIMYHTHSQTRSTAVKHSHFLPVLLHIIRNALDCESFHVHICSLFASILLQRQNKKEVTTNYIFSPKCS